jgi:prepilin signal peptidase PulO-like enzyme (type II secretory pathway)
LEPTPSPPAASWLRLSSVYAARKAALPFVPYLAFGGVPAAFVGDAIIRAYLHLHG